MPGKALLLTIKPADTITFDLYSYSNTDPEKHEVWIEMGKKLT